MKPQACCITVLLFAICGALIAAPAQPARENQAKMAAPGIVLHLDAAAVADAAKEGPIAVWSDRSGAGNDVRQPDQARRPGLDLTAGPDGKPAVVFNGGQWLDGPPAWKAGSKNLTMVAVWKVTPPAGQPVGAYSIVEQAGNEMKGSGRAALLTVRERYGFNGESNDAHDMAPVAPNQWTLSILTINEKGIVRLNHNGVTAKARYDAGSYALDATRLRVGAKASTSGERLIGAIAEIMLFDRVLDEDEISRLEADLIRKHGIARSQIKLADRSTRKSKAPKYSYAETLSEQVAQLEEDPFIKRFAESREELAADRYRPIYHFVSPEHVMNDPNGLCYWQDRWHLFYQGYPPEDPRQHWGHAVSDDLIHWRDLPYAIYPDPEECCFSGSTLVEDDRVIAMYHGTGAGAGTMVAVADDPLLLNWEKVTGEAVIKRYHGAPYNVFDPCIWKKGNKYYGILAGRKPTNISGAPRRTHDLFESENLADWKYLGEFVEGDDFSAVGDDGACPYFWPLGNKHLLMWFSHRRSSMYFIGDYDQDRDRFIPRHYGRFSFGPVGPGNIHAPSGCPDPQCKGEVIAIFNVNPGYHTPGWNQVMSLPRRLRLLDGDWLGQTPIETVVSLRGEHKRIGLTKLPANQEVVLEGIAGNAVEIAAEIDPKGANRVELNVLRSPDAEEVTRIAFYMNRGYSGKAPSTLVVDTTDTSLADDIHTRTPDIAPMPFGHDETLNLQVFIDKSVIDVFANGKQALTLRVYPSREDSVGVSLLSKGRDAQLNCLDLWQMKPIFAGPSW